MYRLGFIGCGNMGGAMLHKLLDAGIFRPEDVIVSDASEEVRSKWGRLGVYTTHDNREACKAQIVFLAVKPQFLRDAMRDMEGFISTGTLFVSIVMSYSLQTLEEVLGSSDLAIIRVMPNTPALVGEGVLAVCKNAHVTEAQWDGIMRAFSCMGMAREVTESLMDAVTGVSGCGPAFACLFMEALADAGVRGGLSRKTAMEFAAQTLLGSAKLLLESEKHPGELKDMVTSPAGATIEGVAALEKNGFRYAIMDAVDSAIQRAKAFETK